MSKHPPERVLVKNDSDLFQLVRRLTSEQLPVEIWNAGHEAEPVVPVELPFSILLQAVDRLPVDQARALHSRLENRLVGTTIIGT